MFQITELRVTRGDDLWLSPVRGRDSLVVHFSSVSLAPRLVLPTSLLTGAVPAVNKFNIPGCREALGELEAALEPYEPRAHWGKLHHMGAPTLAATYGEEALGAFRALCQTHDPDGKFLNEWFERLVFEDAQDHLELVLPAEEAVAPAATAPVDAGEGQ